MKTIIIHHLQSIWDEGLIGMGTDFETEIYKVCEHLNKVEYDRIIVTNFEANLSLDEDKLILSDFYPEVHDYMYGWERKEVEEWKDHKEGVDFCQGGQHSEVVLTPEWMRKLEGEIYICGAFDGECIEDLECALEGCGKNFERLNHLIV